VIYTILEDDKQRPAKQRHTAKRIFERLKDEYGFTGGYRIVKDYVRSAEMHSREMFISLTHAPGEAQADFGEALVVVAGVELEAHYLTVDLRHSDDSFVAAFPAETTEAFLEGHVRAFAYFGGVPTRILFDSKIAVARIPGSSGAEDQSAGPGRATGRVAVAGVFRATAASARSEAQKAWQSRVCAGASSDGDLRHQRSDSRHRRCLEAGHDQLRCGTSSAAVPHRTTTAVAGYGELSPSAYGAGKDHAGRRLHEFACGGVRMNGTDASATNTAAHTADTPLLLLEHHLKELRLPTILREYDKVARQCAVEQVDYQHYLLRITELELLDRERRATERRIRQAKFPVVKTMETFDFLASPSLNKTLVLELARCEFLARRENVLLLGDSGTGKTYIAPALGLAACQRGHRVRFTTTAALVSELIEARDNKKLLRFQKQIASYELLIADELGFVPLSKTGAELLLEMLSQRYERGSTMATSNLPFQEWIEVLGSERLTGALLDRLTHHVHILEMNGDSYRLKQSRRKQTPSSERASG